MWFLFRDKKKYIWLKSIDFNSLILKKKLKAVQIVCVWWSLTDFDQIINYLINNYFKFDLNQKIKYLPHTYFGG